MSRLGRGLNSLIQDIEKPVQGATTTINVELIRPNKYQPRRIFDQDKLAELSDSIKENGLIQPIVVCKHSDTDYELIAGERRLEACKLAGLTEVPIYIKNVTDKERLVLAIIENVQRENLSPIEEAKAYQQLISEFELTHSDVSKIMSKDRATVTNTLRLLKLSEKIQDMIEKKLLTSGHARAILSVNDELQENFADEIIKKQFSVRKAEEEAQNYNSKVTKQKNNKKIIETSYIKNTEKEISKIFGNKIKIKEKKYASGEVSIQFKNQNDLDEIINFLKLKNPK